MTDLFSHPWLSGLFCDPEVQNRLSPQVQLDHMLRVEAAFSRALANSGAVPQQIGEQAAAHILGANPDMGLLRQGVAEDGVVVPALVRHLKGTAPEDLRPAIHKGLTSQDVIDTALVLALKEILPLFSDRLRALDSALAVLSDQQGDHVLMGRTRMQAALPITVADRIQSWQYPLTDHLERVAQLSPRLLCLQLGGAVGDRAALGQHSEHLASHMAKALGLGAPDKNWHARRDAVAEFANWLSLITGTLGKMGQDAALMAQQGIDEITLSGGGGSSAMPHKQNPVLAELLITLARFNAVQLSAMHQALIHEQERSGAAWTLEWMVLPQMIHAAGRALTSTIELVSRVDRIGTPLAQKSGL